MESPDYPIAHFSKMTAIATALKPLPAEILEHCFNYSSFGSWWLVVRHRGIPIRVVFDGREQMLTIERSSSRDEPSSWQTVVSEQQIGAAVNDGDLMKAIVQAAG